ncbi:catechol 2,3-dioxygenase-like lactoylglutathione lyase family enzyme [Sphingobium sp. OAS761]|uniref:VOC family protein n=1 Tax=Sphingobium sp. OAS761 TaxID=2817901 RepID=UPI00209E5FF8|nr:VOC family protein [Sphingobium sp. OAS761]MCP1468601.1 catechol 2,3-dioxygenase-like lactoylglutathione lyase family enzyme [Sphingobium sp. OAS761]
MGTTTPRRITQIAFATRDLDASMAFYSRHLGIGPWFVLPIARFADPLFHGAPCDAQVRVAFANSGGMEYEMVQQLDDTPSIWRDFLKDSAERERFHHLCERTHDFSESERRLLDEGYRSALEGATRRGRFTYFAHPDAPGTYLELLESSPSREAMYAHILLHGQSWDGRDPVRSLPPL